MRELALGCEFNVSGLGFKVQIACLQIKSMIYTKRFFNLVDENLMPGFFIFGAKFRLFTFDT